MGVAKLPIGWAPSNDLTGRYLAPLSVDHPCPVGWQSRFSPQFAGLLTPAVDRESFA